MLSVVIAAPERLERRLKLDATVKAPVRDASAAILASPRGHPGSAEAPGSTAATAPAATGGSGGGDAVPVVVAADTKPPAELASLPKLAAEPAGTELAAGVEKALSGKTPVDAVFDV